jgi:hypothetical protein
MGAGDVSISMALHQDGMIAFKATATIDFKALVLSL